MPKRLGLVLAIADYGERKRSLRFVAGHPTGGIENRFSLLPCRKLSLLAGNALGDLSQLFTGAHFMIENHKQPLEFWRQLHVGCNNHQKELLCFGDQQFLFDRGDYFSARQVAVKSPQDQERRPFELGKGFDGGQWIAHRVTANPIQNIPGKALPRFIAAKLGNFADCLLRLVGSDNDSAKRGADVFTQVLGG